jgi:hypothetical protein
MAAIVFSDGASWVVSGSAFRRLLDTAKERIDPESDADLLVTLDEYESVKGITLDLLEPSEQRRLARCIYQASQALVEHLGSALS